MMSNWPPGLILIIGALLLPLLRGRAQAAVFLMLPVLSAAHLLWFLPAGTSVEIGLFGYTLNPIHIDRLNLVWGYIFHIAAFVSALYALQVRDPLQHVSAMIYAGAAIGAVLAGDLITLFVYWELTAISSVFLIWARRSERSYRSGMRYLIIQVGSGVLLLSGILLHFRDTGSLGFTEAFYTLLPSDVDHLWLGLTSPGTQLIFIAFGIKAAFPLLHNWLTDAYPEATPSGTVFLSAFTTKLAIYALARGFPGTGILIYIGAVMTVFPIFFAIIENDLRRVLSYSLIDQLGFMVTGIGLANFVHHPHVAEMALNGTAGHAVAHILYKGLLFMTMGAVLMRTGTINGSELGGLYKSMPWTTAFCIIGAASISAFPLFSGFVTKSMIFYACAEQHLTEVWLVLLVASAGVFFYSGIKIPFLAFFAHDSGQRVKEAPWNMLLAMGVAAALCILIGVMPGPLYAILPFEVTYQPYTVMHVITQLQLLMWSALAFTVLMRTGIYPREIRSVNLDSDWTYRKAFPAMIGAIRGVGQRVGDQLKGALTSHLKKLHEFLRQANESQEFFERNWSTSTMVFLATVLLVIYLLLYYL